MFANSCYCCCCAETFLFLFLFCKFFVCLIFCSLFSFPGCANISFACVDFFCIFLFWFEYFSKVMISRVAGMKLIFLILFRVLRDSLRGIYEALELRDGAISCHS
ncbi:hypothetical protein GLYMA_11G170201v4 [Glycine max]|nr:hypothetical protein GLYMA_11G170201v4 [Glycine max]KAH1159804.1 hypothetical protein GYH30_031511 [Glycine max]